MVENYKEFVKDRKEEESYVPTFEEFTDLMLKFKSINTIPEGVTIQIEKGKRFKILHDEWEDECFLTSEQIIGFKNNNHTQMFMCKCCPDLYAVLSWGKGLDLIVKWENMTLCFPDDMANDLNLSDKSTSTIQ